MPSFSVASQGKVLPETKVTRYLADSTGGDHLSLRTAPLVMAPRSSGSLLEQRYWIPLYNARRFFATVAIEGIPRAGFRSTWTGSLA